MELTQGTRGGVSFYSWTGLERRSHTSQQVGQVVVVVAAVMAPFIIR